MLDFKADSPESFNSVPSYLQSNVLKAVQKYIPLLRDFQDGTYNRYAHMDVDRDAIKDEDHIISAIRAKVDALSTLLVVDALHLPAIYDLIPDMMMVLGRILGYKSVLIVDEYDTPLMSAICFAEIDFSKYFFWVQTGSMKVLEEYRQHHGPLAELMTLDRIDDYVVEHIESQEQTRFPSDLDKETFKEIADACMSPFGGPLNDIQNMGREPLHARTIVRLLYQAGYIVPTGKDSVGIPNIEVHRALDQFYDRVAAQHMIHTPLLEPTYEEMGINKGDLGRFAQSLNSCFIGIPDLTESTWEVVYRNLLSAYVYPVTQSGYAIQPETVTGNGRADISIFPDASHIRSDSTPPLYYVFELKSYDGHKSSTNGARLSSRNRRKVARHVLNQAIQAQDQVYDWYLPTLAGKAKGCDCIYIVGISFWINRFCMVVTKREPVTSDDGVVSWPVVDYEGGVVINSGDIYSQLGDVLDNAEHGVVRQYVLNGHLVILTI
ncbi:hypothetical protein EV175_004359 [Coemansia sp. RSA 1933]|nr:hypothetical protein EV175_004359 [Coemansia sp. RSA 1933]